eukprot:scaffold31031_cov49-Phaeocystis_antarctica.AAC.2
MALGTDSHFYGSRAGSHPERPHRRPGTIPGAGDTYTTRCARLCSQPRAQLTTQACASRRARVPSARNRPRATMWPLRVPRIRVWPFGGGIGARAPKGAARGLPP